MCNMAVFLLGLGSQIFPIVEEKMMLIQAWLSFVAFMRIFAAFNSAFNIKIIRENVYAGSPQSMTPLMGRLFSAWTMMSFTLCVLSAYDIHNKTLLCATWLSFFWAWVHFFC
eukprot:TRINITY_DN227_c0_g1_i2.p1 TRINITY_DN227_c0_g1~~TRINITY_DN227_c0_g1_i2.p1  ORF type:complete len:112 (+),score=6.43 TRINITY_DN227_c0_g1_i2:108-443(+)